MSRWRVLITPLALCWPLLLGGWLYTGQAMAERTGLWPEDEQRLRVGLKLFPACLGALEGLERHLGAGDVLHVVVVYEGALDTARQAAQVLGGVATVRDHPLRVETLPAHELDAERWRRGPPGAIFVATPGLSSGQLRTWSREHGVLVFSPFAGDVERGAVAGLHVADRILPLVNLGQAERAGIRFRSFFLQVAKIHE
ncbi:hypothetical protein [Marichromatium gracile]|uniref:DUF4154 domain-containing protein n=1 Tax=Marichromatium gracile TaxID=1048 RepID=A0A4R4AGR8_MARGR|nr:hypothetical protein [Marichromatium gracile]MBK1707956.1 hypothetical protein [Marichromatium gracile]RNE89500.1 hypothetical protein EBL84_11075 [Marichromatium sp. AB31]RNE91341.1 hypothetical protein EBL85_13945 [Marichromatium sp. AB32]TCW38472.1 hypothetical protein EDC29_102367 [Marichromatium gracile]